MEQDEWVFSAEDIPEWPSQRSALDEWDETPRSNSRDFYVASLRIPGVSSRFESVQHSDRTVDIPCSQWSHYYDFRLSFPGQLLFPIKLIFRSTQSENEQGSISKYLPALLLLLIFLLNILPYARKSLSYHAINSRVQVGIPEDLNSINAWFRKCIEASYACDKSQLYLVLKREHCQSERRKRVGRLP